MIFIAFFIIFVCVCVFLYDSQFLSLPFWFCVVFCRMSSFCVFPICIFKSSLNICQTTPKAKIFVGADNFDNAG